MPRIKAHSEDQEPFLEKRLMTLRFRRVIRYIPANSKILDVGCGYDGKLLYKIRKRITRGFGIDVSVNEDKGDEKITLQKHDLADPLPFETNSFDTATSLANLEHIENPSQALQEIHRVLKPGGILLLTAPSIYGKPVLELLAFLRIISRQEIRDHKNYFNKKILESYCKKIGFSSFKHRYFQLGMNNFLMAKK